MKKLLFAAPLALAAGALLATPASAASAWNNPRQLKAEITQLDRQIDYAQRGHGLSSREAKQLGRQVDQLERLYRQYARGGFNRGEIASLSKKVDAVKMDIARQAHDRDGRKDRNDNRGHDDRRSNHR